MPFAIKRLDANSIFSNQYISKLTTLERNIFKERMYSVSSQHYNTFIIILLQCNVQDLPCPNPYIILNNTSYCYSLHNIPILIAENILLYCQWKFNDHIKPLLLESFPLLWVPPLTLQKRRKLVVYTFVNLFIAFKNNSLGQDECFKIKLLVSKFSLAVS